MLNSLFSFVSFKIFLIGLPLCIDEEDFIPVRMPAAIEVPNTESNGSLKTGSISLTSVIWTYILVILGSFCVLL